MFSKSNNFSEFINISLKFYFTQSSTPSSFPSACYWKSSSCGFSEVFYQSRLERPIFLFYQENQLSVIFHSEFNGFKTENKIKVIIYTGIYTYIKFNYRKRTQSLLFHSLPCVHCISKFL